MPDPKGTIMANILLSFAIASTAFAGCPNSINDAQRIVGADPKLEFVTRPGPRHLEHVSVFRNHPSDTLGLVRGDDWSSRQSVTWHIPDSNHWAECHYKQSATVVRVRLPSDHICVFNMARGGVADAESFHCTVIVKRKKP